MRLLDTDLLIDVGRGFLPAVQWLQALPEAPQIPGVVSMELIAGCQNKAEVRRIQALVAPYAAVWPTEADCRRALADFTQFHLSDNLGLTDALIAATAVGRGATLCTFNVRHFRVVPGLTLEQPYLRP